MIRSISLTRLTTRLTRLSAIVTFAAIVLNASAASAYPPDIGSASSFAVLGGPAVTCTDSVVVGEVGVDLGGAVTQTNCTIVGGSTWATRSPSWLNRMVNPHRPAGGIDARSPSRSMKQREGLTRRASR